MKPVSLKYERICGTVSTSIYRALTPSLRCSSSCAATLSTNKAGQLGLNRIKISWTNVAVLTVHILKTKNNDKTVSNNILYRPRKCILISILPAAVEPAHWSDLEMNAFVWQQLCCVLHSRSCRIKTISIYCIHTSACCFSQQMNFRIIHWIIFILQRRS